MLDLSEFFIIEKDGVPINGPRSKRTSNQARDEEHRDDLLFKITKEASKPIQSNKEADELWLNKTTMGKLISKWTK